MAPRKNKPFPDSKGNYVFQDLKRKGGTKSTRSAEKLKRDIKRKRNDRVKEALGISKFSGRKGAAARLRAKMAQEMVFEKSLVEANEHAEDVMPVFSSGVDRERIEALVREKRRINSSDPTVTPDTAPESPKHAPSASSDLEIVLRTDFNHLAFRPGQREGIESTLAGLKTLLILPTGQGKSLCYQIPARILGGLTVVVSPLIALMSDQLKSLPLCLRGAALHSSLSPSQVELVMTGLKKGEIDVLFVAPERLLMYSFPEACPTVELVCIDEAHCLSEWSHSFRPSYLRISEVIQNQLRAKRVLALTATATDKTVQSICGILGLEKVIRKDGVVVTGESPSLMEADSGEPRGMDADLFSSNPSPDWVQRPNLKMSASLSYNPTIDAMDLLRSLDFARLKALILYVPYQWQTEHLARLINQNGLGEAAPYHGALTDSERADAHRKFLSGEVRLIVATVAFGMGIDKSNIRAVVHLAMPKSIENLVQETGRAGRDGGPATCHCFVCPEDYERMRRVVFADSLEKLSVIRLLSFICARDRKYVQGCDFETPVGHAVALPESETASKLNCTKEQLAAVITNIEKNSDLFISTYLNFPRQVKLRFFRNSPEDLVHNSAFIDSIMHCGSDNPADEVKGDFIKPNSGVYTVDVLRSCIALGLSPPMFMRALSEHARDQFAVEKKNWSHFLFIRKLPSLGAAVEKLSNSVLNSVRLFQQEQLCKIDCCFALLMRLAIVDRYQIDDEYLGHRLIQSYFSVSSSEAVLEQIIGQEDAVRAEIKSEMAKHASSSEQASLATDWKSHEVYGKEYKWIRADVLSLINNDFEGKSVSSSSVAKIFHGIPSPNFTTKEWKTHPCWARYSSIPFETLSSMISSILLTDR